MTKAVRRINYDDFAAGLPALLETIAEEDETLLIERKGRLYRVESLTWASAEEEPVYDPERTRLMLAKTAGSFTGIDRDRLMKDLHSQRRQDSHGRPA